MITSIDRHQMLNSNGNLSYIIIINLWLNAFWSLTAVSNCLNIRFHLFVTRRGAYHL